MENVFYFKGVTFPANEGQNIIISLHLVCPLQDPPFHRTKSIRCGDQATLDTHQGPFFVVLQGYQYNRLLYRRFSQVDPRQTRLNFNDLTVHYEFQNKDLAVQNNGFYLTLEEARNTLSKYVEYQLQMLQHSNPIKESLRQTHSVFYDFQCTPTLQIPYVALAGRGSSLLKGITFQNVHDWQQFFIREMPVAMRECGFSVATFCKVKNSLTAPEQFFLYDQIAKTFSHFVSSKITYRTDESATFARDYVGFNVGNNGELFGDCEDGSQLVYDTLRIFRAIFPVTKSDLSKGASSLCYHISFWLQDCDLWLFQGAVGENASDTHVWCALLPYSGGPAHYVESTGMPQQSFYKFVVRAWQVSPQQLYKDMMLFDPHSGKYGLGSSYLTHPSANGKAIFYNWARPTKQDISNELNFVNLLDCPLMHPMDILTGNFK